MSGHIFVSSTPGLEHSQRQGPADLYVKSLVDYRKTTFEGFVSSVNVALDTVGRDAQVIENVGVSAGYFYVEVTTGLNKIADLLTDERSAQ
jgi:predicted porin